MPTTIRALLAASPTLASQVQVLGDDNAAVEAITYDSRAVKPGVLFVALRGTTVDGHRFIDGTLDRGAEVLLVETPVDDPRARCQLVAADSRAALAQLALAFYRDPSRELGLIGVTGTKGKTSTSFLIEWLLADRFQTGLIGTVDLKVGPRRWRNPAHQTTPESLEVQRLLREMVEADVDWAVLETSSHALATHRVTGCAYDIAVITNVTHEHLDFHGTFEHYLAAKASLFDRIAPPGAKSPARARGAVINRDDPGAATMLGRVRDADEITYGLTPEAAVHAEAIVSDGQGVAFTLRSPWGAAAVRVPLIGRFNVANVLAASAACLLAGLPLDRLVARLATFPGIPGRLQRIDRGQPFLVVVDYAHNADSLAQVLHLLRGVTAGRLIALFGSGGERDVAKRAMMGRVCAELADFGIFADEDPRGEDPALIVKMIADGAAQAGWREGEQFARITDRRDAIDFACGMARPGDTIVLAGKGHEETIIYADRAIAWDEAAEARRALQRLGYERGE